MAMDPERVFLCWKIFKEHFCKIKREILGGRARNISCNTLQLYQKANILVILYDYLNTLSIDT